MTGMSEEEIVEQYPEIFEYWHKEPSELEVPTPSIAVFGFQCGQGWHNLIVSLCETLERLDVNVKVTTIKEKFGGLRFYHNGVTHLESEVKVHMAMGAIQQAERMSRYVCEVCGAAAEFRQSGRLRTLCDECWSEQKAVNRNT